MSALTVRRVTDPQDPALETFGRIQNAVYFEPNMLIPPSAYARVLTGDTDTRQNFLLLAEKIMPDKGKVVLGGVLFHYLHTAHSGFSSFMGVTHAARDHGVARALSEARWQTLEQASGGSLRGVFIDVVSPARLSAHELQEEADVGSDPVHRRVVFQALGFRTVDLEYQQPMGGKDGGPVTNMDLLFLPATPGDTVDLELVLATMRAYWGGWMNPERLDQEVQKLRTWAQGRTQLALLPATESPRF